MTNSLCEELISLSRGFFCFKMRWSNLFFFYFKICSWFTLYFSVIYKVYLQVNDCIILCFVFVVCLCKSAGQFSLFVYSLPNWINKPQNATFKFLTLDFFCLRTKYHHSAAVVTHQKPGNHKLLFFRG